MTRSIPTIASVLAVIVVGSISSAGPARADTWSDQVLAAVNAARAAYSAPPSTWNSDLYPAALQWAQACNFRHSSPNGAYGETLAVASGSKPFGIADAVALWMASSSNYDFNREPGDPNGVGDFTQVVWKSTTQVTAATADCHQSGTFIVARYTPRGNVKGSYLANVGPKS
jgi:uncharacterized protein YkwD